MVRALAVAWECCDVYTDVIVFEAELREGMSGLGRRNIAVAGALGLCFHLIDPCCSRGVEVDQVDAVGNGGDDLHETNFQ